MPVLGGDFGELSILATSNVPRPWAKLRFRKEESTLLITDFEGALLHDLEHVLPNHALGLECAITGEVSWMEPYHKGNILELIPSAAGGAHLARWVMTEET